MRIDGILNLNKHILMLIISVLLFEQVRVLNAQQLAFPGAEGFGKFTKGGRGGAVYEVTNLEDSGPGSLRDVLNKVGPRTIVFRVSGTIQLKSDLKIIQPYVTIAGQTAPGDGICLRDYTVYVNTNQVIIRYMRFRLGDESNQEDDSIWGRYRKNIMIDHCSASWSVDEAISFYGNDSLTIQWCLVSESLYMSVHSKGAHGYGGIWGGTNSSFHHNLLAHHSSRNPRFAGGETPACVNVDFRNNVIYNWGFNSAYGGEGGKINMVANYFKPGPATKSSVKTRIVQPSDRNGRWYIEDNYVDESATITENNWAGGVQGSNAVESQIRAYTPFPYDSLSVTQTAQDAYESVLADVGANLPRQDSVDERIISDVRNGNATFDGHYYEIYQNLSDTSIVRGIIDSQRNVGGWPDLLSLPAPVDDDHDGMADEWELTQGLSPDDDSDRNIVNSDGYTMLEVYLNSLTPQGSTPIAEENSIPVSFYLTQNYPNPFNPHTTIAYSVTEPGLVDIKIFNINGQLIKQLLSSLQPVGSYTIQWNGMDNHNNAVTSGLYFCVFKFNDYRKTIKMQLLR